MIGGKTPFKESQNMKTQMIKPPFQKKMPSVTLFTQTIALSIVGIMAGVSLASADVFTNELEKSIIGSEKINAARQGYLSARENLVIAKNGQEWSANLAAGHKYSETSTNGADFAETNNRDVSVTIKRNLFDGGLSSAEETVAGLQLDLAITQVKLAEEDVLTSAIEAYTGVVTATDQLKISQSNVARLNEHLKAAEIQLQVGESTPTQLAGTKARLARANAGLIQAETALANAEAQYVSLIGPKPIGLTMPPIASDLPASALAAGDLALESSANHKLALLNERITRKNMDVLVAQVKPTVDFSLVGKTVDNTLTTRDSEEVSASINFSMPLFPTASVRAKSRGVVADHRQSLFNLQDNKRATRLAAENAYRNYTANTAVITAYEAELEAAIAVRDGTAQEVQFGEKTILDQLDAEQDVVTAQLNLLVARRDVVNASYRLKAATGQLYADNLGLLGQGGLADEPAIESPLVGPYPRLNYPE